MNEVWGGYSLYWETTGVVMAADGDEGLYTVVLFLLHLSFPLVGYTLYLLFDITVEKSRLTGSTFRLVNFCQSCWNCPAAPAARIGGRRLETIDNTHTQKKELLAFYWRCAQVEYFQIGQVERGQKVLGSSRVEGCFMFHTAQHSRCSSKKKREKNKSSSFGGSPWARETQNATGVNRYAGKHQSSQPSSSFSSSLSCECSG